MLALDARLDWMGLGQQRQQQAPPKRGSVADRLKAFLRGRRE